MSFPYICTESTTLYAAWSDEYATLANRFDYIIENGEVKITKFSGADKDVIIPREIEGCPVTVIGEDAFNEFYYRYNERRLESVTIPDDVKRIESSAFEYCTSLKHISFPDDLEYIGESAFSFCEALEEIALPDSVTELGAHAFSGCEAVTELFIPASVGTIYECSFFTVRVLAR